MAKKNSRDILPPLQNPRFAIDYASFVIAERCLVKELKESDLDITRALDERVGFFSHYVLNVSWPPTNCKGTLLSAMFLY